MKTAKIKAVFALLFVFTIQTWAGEDIVLADFETTFDGWTIAGEAFGSVPSRGERPWPGPYSGFLGSGWANSFRAPATKPKGPDASLMNSPFHAGKVSTGSLTSPPFVIGRPFLNFLIGGGNEPEKVAIHLLIDRKKVASASGPNSAKDIIPRLDWHAWDVSAYHGRQATLEIVDRSTSAYLMVDHIVQSDRDFSKNRPTREIGVDRQFLHLPVKEGARATLIRLSAPGHPVREFEIQLAANEKPDFWVYEDLSEFKGKKLTIQADWLPNGPKGLASLKLEDEVPGADVLYREAYRPQFHFSAIRGRLADPIGLIFYDGEYHMFFQHWAYGNNTPPIRSWGHAVSPDLVHWKELPTAVYSDELGTIFSGCAVVDEKNVSGFQTGKEKPILLFYTSAAGSSPASRGRLVSQSISYSNDRGRTWTKHAGNPIIPNILGGNRDPKVFWHEPTKCWIMMLYLQSGIYTALASGNLKAWTRLSDVILPGVMENPDFFMLPEEGDPSKLKAVFSANGNYYLGAFDGKTFVPEGELLSMPWTNLYAEQTFANRAPGDDRVIQIAYILNVKFPGMPFSQQMAVPRELSLRRTALGLRLCALPIREIEKLRGGEQAWSDLALKPGANPLADIEGELFDLECELTLGATGKIAFELCGAKVSYHAETRKLEAFGKSVELVPEKGRITFRFLVDRTSVELFANRGLVHISFGIAPESKTRRLSLTCEGPDVLVNKLQVWELQSIWQTKLTQ